jgi:hypothetical protein
LTASSNACALKLGKLLLDWLAVTDLSFPWARNRFRILKKQCRSIGAMLCH